MSTINIDLAADTILNVMIGQQEENEVREVVFDYSGWYTTYGSGTISLAIQRPKDEWPYEGTLTVDNLTHKATWEISDTDSAYAGVGQIQLSYTVGTAKKKSVVYRFTVYKSLGALGNVITPIQIQTFIDEVTEALEDMQEELNDVKQDLAELEGGGLTEDAKEALLACFRHIAFIDDDDDYYQALYDALYAIQSITLNETSLSFNALNNTTQLTATTVPAGAPVTWTSSDTSKVTVSSTGLVTSVGYGSATVTASASGKSASCSVLVAQASVSSISAVYTPTFIVYEDTPLNDLKSDLVVTATWIDTTSSTVLDSEYSLSGTLAEGTSTVTVSYGGKTTTFTVTVYAEPENMASALADWAHSSSYASYDSSNDMLVQTGLSQSAANSYLSWVGDKSGPLWDDIKGKTLKVKVIMDSPDWVGEKSSEDPKNVVLVGPMIYPQTDSTSSLANRQRWADFGNEILTAEQQAFEYNFVAEIASFTDGTGNPTSTSIFGIFIYNCSTNTVNVRSVEVTELPAVSLSVTQNDTIFNTDSLESIKNLITVTATFANGFVHEITEYTLSGTLSVGTSAITISYQGATTTFNATVAQAPNPFTTGTHTFTSPAATLEVYSGNSCRAILSTTNINDLHANVSSINSNTSACNSVNNYITADPIFTAPANSTVRAKCIINSLESVSTVTYGSTFFRPPNASTDVVMTIAETNQIKVGVSSGTAFEATQTVEESTGFGTLGLYFGHRQQSTAASIDVTYYVYVDDVRVI